MTKDIVNCENKIYNISHSLRYLSHRSNMYMLFQLQSVNIFMYDITGLPFLTNCTFWEGRVVNRGDQEAVISTLHI